MLKDFFKKYKYIIGVFLAVKIIFAVILFVTYPLLPFSAFDYYANGYRFAEATGILEKHLAAYDGQWYLHIARYGYFHFPAEVTQAQAYAFFPLYPLLIYLFSKLLVGNLALTALLISFIASFIATILLYKLVRLDYSEQVARRSVLAFLIFPVAIFYLGMYTESLFMALSLGVLYCIRTHRWFAGGVASFLAALTRPQGVFLALPILIEYIVSWRQSSESLWKKLTHGLALCGAPLGLASYYFFLYLHTGNFFSHLKGNTEAWGREAPDIATLLGVFTQGILQFPALPFHSFFYLKLDLAGTVIFLLLLGWYARTVRISYIFYSLILILLPLSTGTTSSMIRYLSLSFPHYIFLALLGTKYKFVHLFLCVVSFSLLIVLGIRFVHWYWAG